MRIYTKPAEVTVTFSPQDYFLVKTKDDADDILGDYSLNYRIDRSEKGKDDDIGMPVLYLNDAQADTFRKAGFIEVF